MRITRVETVRLLEHPRLVWVLLHTDAGQIGVGETHGAAGAIARAVHDECGPLLIGEDPARVAFHWGRLCAACDDGGVGRRAAAACDLALWDIAAQEMGRPVYGPLGGATREQVPLLAACRSWGSLRDADRVRSEPDALMRELLLDGYGAIKIFPFGTDGTEASSDAAIAAGVVMVAAMREAGGDAPEIVVAGGRWNGFDTVRVARALEPLGVRWLEGPFAGNGTDAALAAATRVPLGGPDVGDGVAVVVPEVAEAGITGLRSVAAHAAAHGLPVAVRNGGGPVAHLAGVHLAAALPNVAWLEVVRAYHRGWFPDILETPPIIEGGYAPLPDAPGLGATLLDEVRERPDAEIEG